VSSLEYIRVVQEHNPIIGLWGEGGEEAMGGGGGGKEGIMKLDAALGRKKKKRKIYGREKSFAR